MAAKLIVYQPNVEPQDVSLEMEERVIIGRDRSCTISIPHPSVSRFHCMVYKDEDRFFIKDLESKNGTFLNDLAIEKQSLMPNDKIGLGDTVFLTFKSEQSPSTPYHVVDQDLMNSDISYIPSVDLSGSQIINLEIGDHSIDAIERAHKGLKALFRVTNALHIPEFGERVFQEILSSLNDAVRADRIFLLGYEPGQRKIEVRQSLDQAPGDTIEFSRTILEETLARKEVVLSRDCLVDERFSLVGSIIGARIKSVICAPLHWEDEQYGLLYLDNRVETGAFTEEDAKLVSAIARQASQTIRRQKLTHDLEDMFTSTIRTLVAALEVKDPYTCGHSERVTQLSMEIAEYVVPSAVQRKNIELSALLHDIGKIGIPEDVLRKETTLTGEEFELIKQHPSMGYKIVGNIKNVGNIALGVKHHHERFDGLGYPDGLKGNQIPLVARIIAVADAFDAMTSTRPYRMARSIDQALAEIENNAGTQFDPELVKIFLKIISKWESQDMNSISSIPPAWLDIYKIKS